MSNLFNFLVVGCGYVGSELAASLLADGHRVTAVRRTLPADHAQSPIRWISADLTDRDSLRVIPTDVDGIFFTAASVRARRDDPNDTYHLGLANFLDHLAATGAAPRRLIFTSSTGVYGHRDGEWVSEDSPCHPELPAGQAMLAAEKLLHACPHPTVALRYSGIYGPDRIRMLRLLQDGPPVLAPTEHIWLNHIHLDDCVGALRHVWNLENPPPVLLASDHQPATRLELLSWLARHTGLPGPVIDPHREPPPRLRGNKRIDGSRLRATGYQFRYPSYRSGYAELTEATSK